MQRFLRMQSLSYVDWKMNKLKSIYKIYKKYNPEESIFGYVMRHKGQIILALLLSLPLALFFSYPAFLELYTEKNKDFFEAFYTDQFDDIVWGFFFLWLPMALSVFMMFRFAGDPKKRRLIKRGEYSLLSQFILLVALSLATLILKLDQNELTGLTKDFIREASSLSYLRFLTAILLITIGVTWEKLIIWLKEGGAYRSAWVIKSFVFLLTGIFCFFLLEMQIGTPATVNVRMLFFNLSYWLILYLFFYLIFRSFKLPSVLCLGIAYFIGFSNYVVVQLRGNYIMFGDLTVLGTAMEVAGMYKFKPDVLFFVSMAGLVLSVILILSLPKLKKRKIGFVRRGITTLIGIMTLFVVVLVAFQTELLYNGIFGLSWDYNKNVREQGYLPYFFSNMNETVSVKVEGYDEGEISNIIEEVNNAPDSITKDMRTEAERFPTIIVIQNETFADLSVLADFKTDKEVTPYINSLKKNTRKGYVNMSVTGGPTANTEFEFLTRSSMIFMPTGSVPYTQYLKQKVPSVVELLKNQEKPYKTTAFHPYYSSGYNRKSVYDFIGFDEAYFYEEFEGKKLIRGLVSDEQDYEDLIAMYEKNKKENPERPQFFFNVTMQNHGGYSNTKVNFDENIKITSFDSLQAIDNFLSLMRTSDTALISFLDYFKKVDEDVIILFYGDHQPAFSEDSVKQLDEHSHFKNEKEIRLSKYIVPYFIWANYEIPESDKIHEGGLTGEYNVISINYLATELLKYAGVKLTEYDKFLMNVHEKIPSMTALGYWDKDGKHYEAEEESAVMELKKKVEKIQYNLIFDKEGKRWNLFQPNEKKEKH